MSFQNPWGALLLLGIPILIIIYIIKARHEDKAVSSTYLWKLSERFRKKKRLPIHRSGKILLFMLRLFAIAVGAFLVCRPVIENEQSKDYVLIVDASASMQTVDKNGESRFDRALKKMEKITDKVRSGHTVSIIVATDQPYYAVKKSALQNELQLALKNLSCSAGSSDIPQALALSNDLTLRSAHPEVYIFTDRDCKEGNTGENVRIVNLSSASEKENITVESLNYHTEKGITEFTGSVVSSGEKRNVAVGLRVDGKTVDAVKVSLEERTPVQVVFREELSSFEIAELFIAEEDSLYLDNSYAVAVNPVRKKKVLLLSSAPFYLKNALAVLENCQLTVKDQPEEDQLSGYDIYIFDGICPSTLPKTGSMIFLNSPVLPGGISADRTVEVSGSLAGKISYHSEVPEDLGLNFNYKESVVSEYAPLIFNASWTPVLSVGDDAVMAVKSYDSGYIHTVFSFDLHHSNIPLTTYFISLVSSMVNYSAPDLVNKQSGNVGEEVRISAPAGCVSLFVKDPEEEHYLLDHKSKSSSFLAKKVGIYKVTGWTDIENGLGEQVSYFAHIPFSETDTEDLEELPVIACAEGVWEGGDGASTDISLYLAIALLIILMLEWGVYYSEQF